MFVIIHLVGVWGDGFSTLTLLLRPLSRHLPKIRPNAMNPKTICLFEIGVDRSLLLSIMIGSPHRSVHVF